MLKSNYLKTIKTDLVKIQEILLLKYFTGKSPGNDSLAEHVQLETEYDWAWTAVLYKKNNSEPTDKLENREKGPIVSWVCV